MHVLIVGRDLALPAEAAVISDLADIWNEHECVKLGVQELGEHDLSGYDAVVIAGLLNSSEPQALDTLSALTNIMTDPPSVVYGLGWGFEVACVAYGFDLSETYSCVTGAAKLVPTSKGESLYQGSDPLRLNPGSRWDVDELPRGLVALASSDTGIESFQHKARPLLVMQQVPADFAYASDARLVYKNLLGNLRYTKK